MNKIPVSQLAAGQRYTKPVYIDDESLFVPEGVPIKDKDIERLKKWRIESVFSDGEIVGDDPHALLNSFFLQAFTSPTHRAIATVYNRQRAKLLEIHGRLRAHETVDQDEVNKIVDALLGLLDRGPNDTVQYILYGMQGETGDVENALNSTLLASLVGQNMQFVRHRLLALATAALLHDIGMLRLKAEITSKRGKLSTEELRHIQTHPVFSYQIITKEFGYAEEVGLAALQHQERWDGSGYPRRLSKESISSEARIIAVVDSFVAMVSKRPYRSSMIGYTAMRNLLSDNGTRFDPAVLRVFIRVLGIYPIGSIVLLSDASICRVLDNRAQTPLKPLVKVMIDADGREFADDSGPTVDLAAQKSLFIAKAVDANVLAQQLV